MPVKKGETSRKLRRYTTLPVLLDLVRRKKLVLLDPSTWEDRNDAQIILEYKHRKDIPNLFAMCFCIDTDTIHHWKTYASGISGCCVCFDEAKLLRSFKNVPEIRCGDIEYKRINAIESRKITASKIPFTKRWPYRYEKEFRILWEGETDKKTIDIDIDLKAIDRITLSQGMPVTIADSIKSILRKEINDSTIKIYRSTLYENSRWINAFKGG